MYNGIGLSTARGSGTNGYVQRNMSFVKQQKKKTFDRDAYETSSLRQPNKEILLHEQKRMIEVKCLELQLQLEDDGVDEVEVLKQVGELRLSLKSQMDEKSLQPKLTTHVQSAAKLEEQKKLARAFGINTETHIEGAVFDRDLQVSLQ
jgi:hypothetical protein